MKISKTVALVVASVAVAGLPTTAIASGGPSGSDAQKQCRMERKAMGKTAFGQLYGKNKNDRNAFGKCVSERAKADAADQSSAQKNAAHTCRAAEQSDPSAFKAKWGTNKNGKNAFGKCVSATAQQEATTTESQQVNATDNAAKTCRADQKKDPAGFKKKWGTNKNGANAFGKCVSATAQAQGSGSGSGGHGAGRSGH